MAIRFGISERLTLGTIPTISGTIGLGVWYNPGGGAAKSGPLVSIYDSAGSDAFHINAAGGSGFSINRRNTTGTDTTTGGTQSANTWHIVIGKFFSNNDARLWVGTYNSITQVASTGTTWTVTPSNFDTCDIGSIDDTGGTRGTYADMFVDDADPDGAPYDITAQYFAPIAAGFIRHGFNTDGTVFLHAPLIGPPAAAGAASVDADHCKEVMQQLNFTVRGTPDPGTVGHPDLKYPS